jgi:hypothetical protein
MDQTSKCESEKNLRNLGLGRNLRFDINRIHQNMVTRLQKLGNFCTSKCTTKTRKQAQMGIIYLHIICLLKLLVSRNIKNSDQLNSRKYNKI